MNEQIINGEVAVTVPEGFKALSEQEVRAWNPKAYGNNFVMRNEQDHLAIIVSWKKTNFLNKNMPLSKVIDTTKDNLKKADPSFQTVENITTSLAGKEAEGFRYTYSVQDTEQTGIYLLTKYNHTLYAFAYIARSNNFDEQYHSFEEILNSAAFR